MSQPISGPPARPSSAPDAAPADPPRPPGAASAAPRIVLYQFAFSHFNEKARWALDWKGLAAEPRNLLPGFHERRARRLSGATQTPIVVIDGRAVAGSTRILEHLDARFPDPPLFPADPAQRREALEWMHWLDDEVGPATRLGLFHELLADPGCASQIFSAGQPAWKGTPYGWIFPRLVPVLRTRMSIDDASAARARETTHAALERIAQATAASGHLVGDGFTAADLTAAALLFPLSFPPELPFSLPEGPSRAIEGWKARWAGHPGVRWMETIFRRHRRPPGAAPGAGTPTR